MKVKRHNLNEKNRRNAYKNSKKSKKNSFFLKTRKKPGSGALWGVVRGRFGLSNYVMIAVLAVPSTGLGKAVSQSVYAVIAHCQ